MATQGVSSDVAAASSALNSTIRRFAGGVGGQVVTILLASLTLGGSGRPRFAAFTVSYLAAAGLCLAGAVSLLPGPAITRLLPGAGQRRRGRSATG